MTITNLNASQLETMIAASKGGNVAGITEDHRHEMMNRLRQLRSADTMTDEQRSAAWDRVAAEMQTNETALETGREIINNTAITLIIILVLAGIGFWFGA